MGFWHGANWTFILWGLYHATFIFIERKLQPLRKPLPWAFHPLVTWPLTLRVSMLSWIPFRAESLTTTFALYGRVLNPSTLVGMGLRENTYLVAAAVMLLFVLAWNFAHYVLPRLQRSVVWYPARVLQYTIMVALILVFLRPINQFIYFQF